MAKTEIENTQDSNAIAVASGDMVCDGPEVCPTCKGRCGSYDLKSDVYTPCLACGGTGVHLWDYCTTCLEVGRIGVRKIEISSHTTDSTTQVAD